MSENWTKGTWEIRKYKDPYGRRNVAVEILTDEIIIAKLGIEIDEECAANAHLIAAAPDLYDALQVVENVIPESPYREIVRAALKKARGES